MLDRIDGSNDKEHWHCVANVSESTIVEIDLRPGETARVKAVGGVRSVCLRVQGQLDHRGNHARIRKTRNKDEKAA